MNETKVRTPAIEGWFTLDAAEPRLLGSQCRSCRSYFFPKETLFCRNPGCQGTEFDEAPLSRRGRIWSYTNNCYKPPAPYVSPDPFVPYAIAAVELPKERMVVLGQLASGVDYESLSCGMEVDLVLETLYADDTNEYLVWKWQPVEG